MPPNCVAPCLAAKSFNCPHCGVFAHQEWFTPSATSRIQRPINPSASMIAPITAGDWQRSVADACEPSMSAKAEALFGRSIENVCIAKCASCLKLSIWVGESITYPAARLNVEPNFDLNPEIKADFNEARTIVATSPRGAAALLRLCVQKLCKQLGKAGENINADIGALVKDGLNPKVQMALDIVRVVGNEAVHPGELDLNDTPEACLSL
jgi:hypothetical protein